MKYVAERVGFEPTVPVRAQRFSRPSRSTTPAPLREDLGANGRENRALSRQGARRLAQVASLAKASLSPLRAPL